MRTLVVTLLLAAALLAGCATPASQTQNAAPSDPITRDAVAPSGAPGSNPANASGALVLKSTPVAYSGKTGSYVCVFAVVVGRCPVASPGTEEEHALGVVGVPARIFGTVTYGPSTPGTTFFVSICKSDANSIRCTGEGMKPSPAKFLISLSDYAAGDDLSLGVGNSAGAGAGPAGVFGEAPTDFKIEATLESMAPG